MRLMVILGALLMLSPHAQAVCRTPESVIAWYDHNQVAAEFTPLYGPPAIHAIGRLNEILPGSGIEGDAVLVVEEPGEPVFFVYLYRDN